MSDFVTNAKKFVYFKEIITICLLFRYLFKITIWVCKCAGIHMQKTIKFANQISVNVIVFFFSGTPATSDTLNNCMCTYNILYTTCSYLKFSIFGERLTCIQIYIYVYIRAHIRTRHVHHVCIYSCFLNGREQVCVRLAGFCLSVHCVLVISKFTQL